MIIIVLCELLGRKQSLLHIRDSNRVAVLKEARGLFGVGEPRFHSVGDGCHLEVQNNFFF